MLVVELTSDKFYGGASLKKYIWICLVVFLSFSIAFASNDTTEDYEYIIDENYDYNSGYEENIFSEAEYENVMMKAKVIEASEAYSYDDGYTVSPVQDVKVKILDTRMKNEILDIKYSLAYYSDDVMIADTLDVGDRVYVYAVFEDGRMSGDAYIGYVDKQNTIWWLVCIYAAAIILIGGIKGLKALISLVITVLAIFFFAIPQIFNGANALLITILTAVMVIIITLILISGFNKKTIAAIIGTTAGIIVAGVFAISFGNEMKLSGIDEESYMLTTADINTVFDFKGIMFSGIIIGALGACMDVGMSLSSAMYELKKESPGITRKRLFKAGMNVGKDMMGTMTNTLILAYVGGSICTILLFMGFDFKMFEILNQEKIAEEILRSLAGSMGLVCTLPLTALICSLLFGGETGKNVVKDREEKMLYGKEK